MKRLVLAAAVSGLIGACTSTVDVTYRPIENDDGVANSCQYVEQFRDRSGPFRAMFGHNDVNTNVRYEGVRCERVIDADLKRGAAGNAMFKIVNSDADVIIKKD